MRGGLAMAMIRGEQAGSLGGDAVLLHLGDLAKAGESLKREAEAEVARARATASAERERIMAGAAEAGHAEGFAKGHAEGVQQGRGEGVAAARAERAEQLDALESAWTAALAQLEQDRRAMLVEARQDIVRLAALIAERVTRRVVEFSDEGIEPMLEAVLEPIAAATAIRVVVHPDDLVLAREALPGVVRRFGTPGDVSIEADASAPRGTCIARLAGGGTVDASIDTQLDRLVRAMSGDDPASPQDTAKTGGDA